MQFDGIWALSFLVAIILVAVLLSCFGLKSFVPFKCSGAEAAPSSNIDGALLHRAEVAETNASALSAALQDARRQAIKQAQALQHEQHALEVATAKRKIVEDDAVAKESSSAADDKGAEGESQALRSQVGQLHRQLLEAQQNLTAVRAQQAGLLSTTQRLQQKLAQSQAQAQDAEQRLQAATQELNSERTSGKLTQPSPVLEYLRGLPFEDLWGLLLGVFGILTVVGPSPYLKIYLPAVAFPFGGLMVSGSFAFFGSDVEGLSFADSMALLLDGDGSFWDYGLWAVCAVIGIVRWVVGAEYSMNGMVDNLAEKYYGRAGQSAQLPPAPFDMPYERPYQTAQRPLLGGPAPKGRGGRPAVGVRDDV